MSKNVQSNKGYNEIKVKKPTDIVGESSHTRDLVKRILYYAPDPKGRTICILGEEGTGKSMVSSLFHWNSGYVKKKEVYVCVNSASIHISTSESELYGHEQGSFTGADKHRLGCIRYAQDGTIFFDEIANMDPQIQKKLLTVFEDRVVKALGGDCCIAVNAQFHVATNGDLEKMKIDNLFRSDLISRIDQIHFYIHPLRQRLDDIPAIALAFINKYLDFYKLTRKINIRDAFYDKLFTYDYPRNVRDLENIIWEIVYGLVRNPKKDIIGADDIVFRQQAKPFEIPMAPADDMNGLPINELLIKNLKHFLTINLGSHGGLENNGNTDSFNLQNFIDDAIKLALQMVGTKAGAGKLLNTTIDIVRGYCKRNPHILPGKI